MMNDILNSIYYDIKNPNSFGTSRKLYNAARLENPDITLKQVKDWLSKQNTYTLHRPARRRFKRNKIFVDHLDELWQADLVEMQEYKNKNVGFRYILTVIDVLSKYAWVIPLQAKTGANITEAFKSIFKERKPVYLQTDKGKEFLNSTFQDYLKSENIKFYTSNNQDIKCSVAERFNRTLKSKMFKYFTAKGTRKYIDILQDLVKSYNESKHKSIKMRPIDVNSSNENIAFKNLYGHETARDFLINRSSKPKLNIGDNVRIPYPVKAFEKGYFPLWSEKIYKIKNKTKDTIKPYYTLEGERGEVIKGRVYPEQVQKVGEGQYRIEKVLDKRTRNRKTEYLIKWMGYGNEYNSWEPAENIINL